MYGLFDSLLVDKACFYRILLFITYSVNAPLTSVFFQEIQHGFFARHFEERVSIRDLQMSFFGSLPPIAYISF